MFCSEFTYFSQEKKKSWIVGQEKEPKTFIPPGKKLGGWRCDGEGEENNAEKSTADLAKLLQSSTHPAE